MGLRFVRASLAGGVVLLGAAFSARSASGQMAAAAPKNVPIGDWLVAPVAELRLRGEYVRDLDGRDRGAVTERARLGADVQRGAVEARIVLQDARLATVDDAAPPPWRLAPLAQSGAYEAWAEAHTAAARPTFVRAGRQPVTWGEGRLLGAADWSPAGRSLDAVRARMPVHDAAFELLAAALSEAGDALPSVYGAVFGARAEWALAPLFAVESYVLARLTQGALPDGVDPSVMGQTDTGSLRLGGDARGWTWGIEGAYQLGRAKAVRGGVDRAAWAAAGHVAYTFERLLWTPTIGAGVSHASGDGGGGTYRAFDPLLPDVHVWHGALDLFAWSNEQEASAHVDFDPFADAIARLEYRYARLVESADEWHTAYLARVGEAPGNGHGDLGHEIDASLAWSPFVPIELRAGYSAIVLGDGARAVLQTTTITPASVSHFAFLQAALQMP